MLCNVRVALYIGKPILIVLKRKDLMGIYQVKTVKNTKLQITHDNENSPVGG